MKKEKTTVSKLAMFDALMENIPDSIYFKDLKSRFIKISKSTAKRLNIDNSDEALGKTDYDFFSNDHAEKAFIDEQNIIKTNIPCLEIEEKETHECGENKWVSTVKVPLYDEKRKIIGTFGISRDITEHKKAEQALEESKKNAEGYLDIAAEIIMSLDKTGNITLLNGSGHKLLGYNSNELTGKNWFETCLPEEVSGDVYDVFKKLINGNVENVINHENTVKTKSGELKTILWHNTTLVDFSGNITGLMSSGLDITDRKKAEKALYESEKSLRNILSSISDPLFVFDQETGDILDVNDMACSLYGYSRDEMLKLNASDMSAEPQASRDSMKNFTNFVPIRYHKKKDGTVFTVEITASLFELNGRNVISASMRDITERKKTEKLLAESEEKFRILFNTSTDGILITETKTQKIKYSNPAICKMLGYTEKELSAMDIAAVHPKEALQGVLSKFKKQIDIREMETLLIRKDGTNFYAKINGFIITINGQKYGAGFFQDITKRKKTEEEILYLSYNDQLTGLYNRRFFEEELKRLDTKRQLPISIVMADVDGLKYVNDNYGHEKGDKLLIAASEIIKNSCRKEDIIARIGGDEFIIFLPKTKETDAQDVIDRIRKASKIYKLEDKINISISLGLSTKKDLNENVDIVIKQADKNMYADKASKKNNKDIG